MAGTAYEYEKTLRLVPGKPELMIEHRLKNTGQSRSTQRSTTTTFCGWNQAMPASRVTFPFPSPPPARRRPT